LLDAVGRLVKNERSGQRSEAFQLTPSLAGLVRQESDEVKFVRGEAAGREGGHEGARTRDRLHPQPGLDDLADEVLAGIADAGRPGVAHQRDPLALLEACDNLAAPARLVEAKVAYERLADAEVPEE